MKKKEKKKKVERSCPHSHLLSLDMFQLLGIVRLNCGVLAGGLANRA